MRPPPPPPPQPCCIRRGAHPDAVRTETRPRHPAAPQEFTASRSLPPQYAATSLRTSYECVMSQSRPLRRRLRYKCHLWCPRSVFPYVRGDRAGVGRVLGCGGEGGEGRSGGQMRSVIADTLLDTLWHLNCYIITPPLHGGHMKADMAGKQRPPVDNWGRTGCVRLQGHQGASWLYRGGCAAKIRNNVGECYCRLTPCCSSDNIKNNAENDLQRHSVVMLLLS